MDTKECIKFLEKRISYGCYFFPVDMNDLLEVVRLLKFKGKYKQMWEELKESWYIKDQSLLPPHKRNTISDIIDYLEKKYFPKIKKTITIEIEAENKKDLDCAIEAYVELTTKSIKSKEHYKCWITNIEEGD